MEKETKKEDTKVSDKKEVKPQYKITLKEAQSYRVRELKTTFYKTTPVITSDENVINVCSQLGAFEVKEIKY